MGLFGRKKKEENFDNLPYLPNDDALPPLPAEPRGGFMGKRVPHAPPLPPMAKQAPRPLPPLPMPKPPHRMDVALRPNLPPARKPHDMPRLEPRLPELREPIHPNFKEPMHDKFIPIEAKEAPKKKPQVFVQLKKYKEIVSTVNKMEGRINDLQTSIDKIKDIRNQEGDLIDSWNNLLSEAKKKMEDVNNKLPDVEEY